jgi:hypothetical protein
MHPMGITKHRYKHCLPIKQKWNQLSALLNAFLLILFKRPILKQGFCSFKRTQKDIDVVSNIYLDNFY